MTSPYRFNSGPPELPLLIAASVCNSNPSSVCLNAETIPRVTVLASIELTPSVNELSPESLAAIKKNLDALKEYLAKG
jgi:hypothetical protein